MTLPITKKHTAIEPEQPVRNRPLNDVLEVYISRRNVLLGGLGTAAAAFFPSALLLARDDSNSGGGVDPEAPLGTSILGFESVPTTLADQVTVPEGYSVQVLIPWGTPITGSFPAFDDTNAANNTSAKQAQQSGQQHDGMYFFPFPVGSNSSDNGLLCVNHENITNYLHTNPQAFDASGNRTSAEEVRKELAAHGISVVQLTRDGSGQWQVVDTGFNRRITLDTPMTLSGPAAGSGFMVTAFSNDGRATRGTVNNCAHGFTPWNTYLTCEENFAGYFLDSTESDRLPRNKSRYGIGPAFFGYEWHTLAGEPSETNNQFRRFDTTPAVGATAFDDFRNEANGYGWVVEIDPFDPSSTPIKRTALGRFAHEGCWPSRFIAGQQLAFYMGDDSSGEYVYKFVTADAFDPANLDRDMLDNGTLYVARYNDDGTGEWLPLVFGRGPLVAPAFRSQAGVLVNTRSAADLLGATPMDRPEWTAVNPANGEFYLTLTNNSGRGIAGDRQANQPLDAANPRMYDSGRDDDPDSDGNVNGHIIRGREDGDNPAATTFTWDIFLFGARADAPGVVNLSGLTEDNQFSSPDGLWFDPREDRGIIWIQTDDSAISDITNNQLLAAVPGRVGDGGPATATSGQQTFIGAPLGTDLRRFLVGPAECEITGIDQTPDGRTLFVNVQHPGEDGDAANPTSTFPGGVGTLPRSATLAITKDDGGVIGT